MLDYYARSLVRKLVLRPETLELLSAELRRVGVDPEALAAFRESFQQNLRQLEGPGEDETAP